MELEFLSANFFNDFFERNSGVVLGYEGYILLLNDDSRVSDIVESETSAELDLRLPGRVYKSIYYCGNRITGINGAVMNACPAGWKIRTGFDSYGRLSHYTEKLIP